MIWRLSDLAYFTAAALALVMRECPIVGIIDGNKGETDGEKTEDESWKENRVA